MKKIKKSLFLFLTIIFILILIPNVKADNSSYCSYSRDGISFHIQNDNGRLSVAWSKSLNPGVEEIRIEGGGLPSFKNASGNFICARNLKTRKEKSSSGKTIIIIDESATTYIYATRISDKPISGVINIPSSDNGCQGVLGGLTKDLSNILKVMRIIAPILVALYTTYDYVASILSKDAEQMKKSNSKFIKRLILVVVLYLLPVIINLLLGIIDESYSTCIG